MLSESAVSSLDFDVWRVFWSFFDFGESLFGAYGFEMKNREILLGRYRIFSDMQYVIYINMNVSNQIDFLIFSNLTFEFCVNFLSQFELEVFSK